MLVSIYMHTEKYAVEFAYCILSYLNSSIEDSTVNDTRAPSYNNEKVLKRNQKEHNYDL